MDVQTIFAGVGTLLPPGFPAGMEPAFSFKADFAVLRYEFVNGDDLDTISQIIHPVTSTALGWCRGSSHAPYIYWSGDNTGTGFESCLIKMKELRENFPKEAGLHVRCKAWWYGSRGSTGVRMGCTFFKGGKPKQSGYLWINDLPEATAEQLAANGNEPPEGTHSKLDFTTGFKYVGMSSSSCEGGDLVANFYYNQLTGSGFFEQ